MCIPYIASHLLAITVRLKKMIIVMITSVMIKKENEINISC